MPSRITNNAENPAPEMQHGDFETPPVYNYVDISSPPTPPPPLPFEIGGEASYDDRNIQQPHSTHNIHQPQMPNNVNMMNPSDFAHYPQPPVMPNHVNMINPHHFEFRPRHHAANATPNNLPPQVAFEMYNDHFEGSFGDEIIQDLVNALDNTLLSQPPPTDEQIRESRPMIQLDIYAYNTLIGQSQIAAWNPGASNNGGPHNPHPQNRSD